MELDIVSEDIRTDYIGFPQVKGLIIGNEAFRLYYEWNRTKSFMVLTIARNYDIVFRSKIVEGGRYIVYNGESRYKTTKVKTLLVIYPIVVNAYECVLNINWQSTPKKKFGMI